MTASSALAAILVLGAFGLILYVWKRNRDNAGDDVDRPRPSPSPPSEPRLPPSDGRPRDYPRDPADTLPDLQTDRKSRHDS